METGRQLGHDKGKELSMTIFDPKRYGSLVEEILSEPRLMPLGPGEPNKPFRKRLETAAV